MDWTWYLFRFDGRIDRAKLWLGGLVLLGLMMALGTVIAAIHVLFGGGTSFHFGASDLFKLVDVLTLSATPIPRTLYLGLMGMRDMSTLDTAPPDRIPVQTTVAGPWRAATRRS